MIEQQRVRRGSPDLPWGDARLVVDVPREARRLPLKPADRGFASAGIRRVGAFNQPQRVPHPVRRARGVRPAVTDGASAAKKTEVIPTLQQTLQRRADRPAVGSSNPQLAWLLTIGGGIGLLAALARTSEKFGLLGSHSTEFCVGRALLGCQPGRLGALDPLLGVAGFAMLTAIGAVLTTGVALSRGLWVGLQAGVTAGVVFVHGLLLWNLTVLGALCPYCLLACGVMIPLFWYTTVHNLSQGWLPIPAPLRSPVSAMVRNRGVVLVVCYLLFTALIYLGGGWLERNPPADGAWTAAALISVATVAGAWMASRFSNRMGLWLSLASAMMMVTAVTEILPHVREDAAEQNLPLWLPAIASILGFLVITYFTRRGCPHRHDDDHQGPEATGGRHRLTRVTAPAAFGGVGAAVAMTTHRLVEGATLALTPSAAVIGALLVHAASEGLALAALLREARESLTPLLLVSSAGPALGVVVATISPLPASVTPLLLAMVGGVLLRTAVVGIKLAVARRRAGELQNWQIVAAVAAAGALGVLTTLTHGHGSEEAHSHGHGSEETQTHEDAPEEAAKAAGREASMQVSGPGAAHARIPDTGPPVSGHNTGEEAEGHTH